MNTLVLNCGSSSVKYQFINPDEQKVLTQGIVERIGMTGALLKNKRFDGDEITIAGEILDHATAVDYILAVLLSKNHGVIKDRNEIDAIGHRVVHGGETFTESVLITDVVVKGIRDNIELAPLHNPHNLRGITACASQLPNIPQVAVFDTAFHQQMPPHAYLYGIPYSLYRRYKIRRYGFHGTSHRYVSARTASIIGKPLTDLKLITCHLGNGCSMAAIDRGVSVDTTMGFTPLEGLLMGTRTGDMDPSVILYIMSKEELGLSEANALLNKHSGLLGISGVSSDLRDILQEANNSNKQAQHAFEVFVYRIRKYLGSFAMALDGLDAIVFTGGIGENSPDVRRQSLEGSPIIGAKLDPSKNNSGEKERPIHSDDSKVGIYIVPTNEELMIAIDTMNIVKSTGRASG